jgi:UDP:flavonoid glycosyltransferase YjiC (YdhE family)
VFWLTDVAADRIMAPPVNELRRQLGLAPIRHITSRWWHARDRVIGLFPSWFASPQSDWPSQAVVTGFPLYDERGVTATPVEVERFLLAGSPPIVFLAGSANRQGHAFFEAAVRACRRLKRRGVLLSRFPEQLPSTMDHDVQHFDYVPLSELLPRAAALVHHGGIGTMAQGLAAGVPQLVMPMTFDQPDNAIRLTRLGAGRWLTPRAFTETAVARELALLIGSREVAARCHDLARRLQGQDAVGQTCDLIEEVGRRN